MICLFLFTGPQGLVCLQVSSPDCEEAQWMVTPLHYLHIWWELDTHSCGHNRKPQTLLSLLVAHHLKLATFMCESQIL